jgi:hypothetical protein
MMGSTILRAMMMEAREHLQLSWLFLIWSGPAWRRKSSLLPPLLWATIIWRRNVLC